MLQKNIANFLNECKHYQFSKSAIEAFTTRLGELYRFFESHQIKSLAEISYQHLLEFVVSGHSSSHVKKFRVWTLHQFFHYLHFHKLVEVNIAEKLPYPKLEKTEPKFLTLEELKTIFHYFYLHASSLPGMRNLVIVMMFGFLGLRLSALCKLNIQDVMLADSLLWISDKGYVRRLLPMPQILCIQLYQYLKRLDRKMGPLFMSKRKKRISERSVQYIFEFAEKDIGLDKHLHCHLFRHTAATQINQTSGVDIARSLLGHRSRKTTERYVHLDGCLYAKHMDRHPYNDPMEASHA